MEVDMKRYIGEIRGLIKHGGYGFARTLDTRQDLYFHCSEMIGTNFDDLKLRDRVSFLVRERKNRIYAIDVMLINPNQDSKEVKTDAD